MDPEIIRDRFRSIQQVRGILLHKQTGPRGPNTSITLLKDPLSSPRQFLIIKKPLNEKCFLFHVKSSFNS